MENRKLRVDLTGKKFNQLTVIAQSHRDLSGRMHWKCICDCGNMTIVQGYDISKGKTLSCKECGNKRTSEKNKKHGHKADKLYYAWINMKTRCYNPNYYLFKNYGGKGISICEEWHDFINFKDWSLNNGYSRELSIDRINNNKNYCPDNCRWVTMKVQQNNRTNNNRITYNGETLTLKQWSEKLKINYAALQQRLRKGCSLEKLFSPVRSKYENYM